MAFQILACGIFRPELEKVLPEVKQALADRDIEIHFAPAALHVDDRKLKAGIEAELARATEPVQALLYGSMCHPEMPAIAGAIGAVCPKEINCIELILSPARKKEIDASGNVFYMTAGWLNAWREIFEQGQGWDSVDARINMGSFERIVVLDSGCAEISDEELFEFFEYTQTPVEIESIDLAYFTDRVISLCEDGQQR